MNYLENMSENLELLDLVEKNCLSTAALENVSNKTEAVLNLKELQFMLTAPSFFIHRMVSWLMFLIPFQKKF